MGQNSSASSQRGNSLNNTASEPPQQRTNHQPSTVPFPKEGIRLSFFDEFIAFHGRAVLEGMTTNEVCEMFVKPATERAQSSYCEMLSSQNYTSCRGSAVGIASVFISHAWKCLFLDVVDALDYHFRNESDIIVWFDLFSNNQHIAVNLDFDWWCNTFKSAIHQFGRTVMVLAPWNNPIPLTRGWCLFELYCTADTNSRFEVAMSQTQQWKFLDDMAKSGKKAMDKTLATINAEKSECFKPEDRDQIFDAVRRTVGFAKLNSMVFAELREWVIATASIALQQETDDTTAQGLKVTLGLLYKGQGKLYMAEPLFVDCWETNVRLFGETHNASLNSLNKLAFLYYEQGKYNLAEPLYQQCLDIRINLHGKHDTDTLYSMINLASCYESQGRYEKAEKLFVECLALRTEANTERHRDTLSAMSHLANVYKNQGLYDKSEALYKECLRLRTDLLSSAPIITAATTTTTTTTTQPSLTPTIPPEPPQPQLPSSSSQPSSSQPLPLSSSAAAAPTALTPAPAPPPSRSQSSSKEKVICRHFLSGSCKFGDACHYKHSDLLSADYSSRSNSSNSNSNGTGTTTITPSTSSSSLPGTSHIPTSRRDLHKDVLTSLNNLAALYEKQQKYDQAESLYLQCLTEKKTLLGERHPDTLNSIHNLAGLYRNKGSYDHSESLYLECLTTRQEVLGEYHPHYLTSLHKLGELYEYQERYTEAETMFQDCLSRRTLVLGEFHPSTLTALSSLAGCYRSQENYEEAIRIYQECLSKRNRSLGSKHPNTMMTIYNLAKLAEKCGNLDEAEALYHECFLVRKEELGVSHPDTLLSLNSLVTLYQSQGRHAEVELLT